MHTNCSGSCCCKQLGDGGIAEQLEAAAQANGKIGADAWAEPVPILRIYTPATRAETSEQAAMIEFGITAANLQAQRQLSEAHALADFTVAGPIVALAIVRRRANTTGQADDLIVAGCNNVAILDRSKQQWGTGLCLGAGCKGGKRATGEQNSALALPVVKLQQPFCTRHCILSG